MTFSSHSTAIHLQAAYILRTRKYRETSLIAEVLTQDLGKVSFLAKGVRKAKSTTAGLLQPFIPLSISFVGKAELKTLTHVEMAQSCTPLKGIALYSGYYLNELIGFFLQPFDPHPEVYTDYCRCLGHLSINQDIEQALRLFELNLMENLGYGLQLMHDLENRQPVEAAKRYQFYAEQGPVEDKTGMISGMTLLALQHRDFTDRQVLAEAKLLMRSVIDHHLQGKELLSRSMVSKVIKHLNNPKNLS